MILTEPLFAAARMTDIGLSYFLTSIIFWRLFDRFMHEQEESDRARWVNELPVMIASGCFVISALFILPVPLSHYLFQWPPQSHNSNTTVYIILILRALVFSSMIYGLAHNPYRQLFCCIGWTVAVHAFLLGPIMWALLP